MSSSNVNPPRDKDANLDPISGEPGAHPVGTGLGAAAAGAATGALGGAVGGPVGAAVGAVVGAVAGGLAGKGVAESVDPTEEDAYWRKNHATQSYATKDDDYAQYGPAYQYGYQSHSQHAGKPFADVESHLKQGWETVRGESKLDWEKAKHASREAYTRVAGRHQTGTTKSM